MTRPARRMAPEARRGHLVAAAVQLYGRMPPERVTVDDVTSAADVSRALFYRYFRGLDELHVAALGSVVAELIDRVSPPAAGPLVEQLRAAIGAFLDVVSRHAPAYVALLRSGSVISTSETDALVDAVRDHVVALLLERTGIPEPTPLQLMTLRGWMALVEGSSLAWLQEARTMPRERLVDWLVAQFGAMWSVTAADPARS